jgi:hypothetical protein
MAHHKEILCMTKHVSVLFGSFLVCEKTSIKFAMLLGITLLKNVREVQMKLHAVTVR